MAIGSHFLFQKTLELIFLRLCISQLILTQPQKRIFGVNDLQKPETNCCLNPQPANSWSATYGKGSVGIRSQSIFDGINHIHPLSLTVRP